MKCTVGQLFRDHFAGYAANRRLPGHYWRAASALSRCRTAALGGHVRRCPNGHIDGVWYNSCHHRWCPQCNGLVGERWLEKQRSRLLACPHRHLIFTLPSELRMVFRLNEQAMSEALFQSVRETLFELVGDERYVGGTAGFILARHTWGRSLSYHPHIHCLVTEGAISPGGQWRVPRKRCFLPARVVMTLYRGKYLSRVRGLLSAGRLRLEHGQSKERLASELNRLGRLAWNVRVGERYTNGVGVATYLARYMRGGPMRNGQLRALANGRVEFRYRSHRGCGGKRNNRLRLKAQDFLARYLAHVPQLRRRTVRCYGLYGAGTTKAFGQACEELGTTTQPAENERPLEWRAYLERLSIQAPVCRLCGQSLRRGEALPRVHGPP